eukprot:Sro1564_g282760.1 Ankyrin Repeat (237) ;mRNA; r:9232-9942
MASRGKYAQIEVVDKLVHEYPEAIDMLNGRDAKPQQCARAAEVKEFYLDYQKKVMMNKVCPCWCAHPMETIQGEREKRDAEQALLEQDGLMKEETDDDGEPIDSQDIAYQKAVAAARRRTNRRLLHIPEDLGESENWEKSGGLNVVAMTSASRLQGVPPPPPPPGAPPAAGGSVPPPPPEDPPAWVGGDQEDFPDDLTQDTTLVSEAPSRSARGQSAPAPVVYEEDSDDDPSSAMC